MLDLRRSGVSWGVLRSLLDYVQRVDGRITAAPPAKATAVSFDWPIETVAGYTDTNRPPACVMLTGALRLWAHDGLLDVRLRSLALYRVGDYLELTIDEGPGRRVGLVRGEYRRAAAQADVHAWVVPEPRLVSEAQHMFGGRYPEGLPFDPLLLALVQS